jgi:hypothetical protein
MNDLLNKVFKFKGEEILVEPRKGQKIPDSWMWTSWQTDRDTYYTLYYTFDKKIINQIAGKILLTGKDVSIANIKEVPSEFLHKIIKWEFRS